MIYRKMLLRDFDKTLMTLAMGLFALGLIFLLSATSLRGQELEFGLLAKQATSFAVALVLTLIIIKVDYQRFIDGAWIIYGINIFLLVLLIFVGHTRLGAQRWFALGQLTLQPSEFIKISFVLALASYISDKRYSLNRLESLVIPFLIFLCPFLLVLLQPDLGTASLLGPTLFIMLYAGGANLKHLLSIAGIGMLSAPMFWHFLREYQRQRLLVFVNPNMDPLGAGYTIIQSKIAIGSGGIFGKGWLAGTQNQLNFLPERHTDFIFSVVGEEWGFTGSAILILLYFILIRRIFRIAKLTSDSAGKLISIGIGTLLSFQIVINISMTVGLMPVVGIPLVLISYGGSSLVATFAAIALVLNVGMRRSTF